MRIRRSVLSCIVILAGAMPAFAQSGGAQKSLGTFGGWRAYTYTENNQPVCYMVETIHFAPSKKLKRALAYLMITHRPAENSKDVISYTSGYNFKAASDVAVTIDKKTFSLFTQKSTAWSRDPATDRAIAAAMQNSKSMKLSGVPAAKGVSAVTDTLDLKSAATAYKAIGKACGLETEPPSKPVTKSTKTAKKPAPRAKHP